MGTDKHTSEHIEENIISPYLLFSHLFTCPSYLAKGGSFNKREVYDYEIEYFLYSEGAMYINDKLYPIHAGDIVVRRPGDTTQAIMPFDCYAIFFDMTGKNRRHYNNYFIEQRTLQQPCDHPVVQSLPTIFHPNDGSKYLPLFDRIQKEFINPDVCSEIIIQSCILQILYQIYQDRRNPLLKQDDRPLKHYDKVRSVVEYINSHLDKNMKLSDLAQMAGYSPNHFHRIFTNIMGTSPSEYIIGLRIKKAKELLAGSRLTVADVSVRCGFENVSYFSTLFTKRVGESPRDFRNRHVMSQ